MAVSRHRSISALLVDVPAGHAALLQRTLDDAGWTVRAVPVQGAEALTAALQRRGWNAVLYSGEGPGAVPARKAAELVRLADPHLPFIAICPGDLSAAVRGLPDGIPSVSQMSQVPAALNRELEQARMRQRVGGAHKLLSIQQAIADHLAAGLEPAALCERVLATIGDSLGWTAGAVWRPDGARLRCATAWHSAGARAAVATLTNATRDQEYAAGQGLPGRVWAFRRPVWLAEVSPEALRAGLVAAAAFPIAVGDECVGVIELYASDAREPNAEVSAMFATIGGQLGAYLTRRRRRARARRSFDGAAALVVSLDVEGRVEIANATACAALGLAEGELLGRDWFLTAVPPRERELHRSAYLQMLAGENVALPPTPGVNWRWSLSVDEDGRPVGALGWGEAAPLPRLVAASAR
jgi:PAS domain-containing protein